MTDKPDRVDGVATWRVFDLAEVIARLPGDAEGYHEFLRVPSLNCGVYRLAAGSRDMQGYHDDDEVYYVLSGRGRLRVGDEDRQVGPGSVLYVRATSEHAFFEIEQDMTMLVFFATTGN